MSNPESQNDSSAPKTKSRKKLLAIVAGVLVLAGLAVPAAIFGPQLIGIEEPSKDSPPGSSSTAAPPPANFTEFRSDKTGIALSYPADWIQMKTADPQILLLASNGPQDSFLVRAVELPTPVGQEQLGEAKQLTDQIVGANRTAQLLVEPQKIEMGGLPGYWYFYSFTDEASGQQGAHSHFFLFKGNTMLTFVFQTVPLEKFQESASTFDQITGSLRVL
jgi:hypothetical protein